MVEVHHQRCWGRTDHGRLAGLAGGDQHAQRVGAGLVRATHIVGVVADGSGDSGDGFVEPDRFGGGQQRQQPRGAVIVVLDPDEPSPPGPGRLLSCQFGVGGHDQPHQPAPDPRPRQMGQRQRHLFVDVAGGLGWQGLAQFGDLAALPGRHHTFLDQCPHLRVPVAQVGGLPQQRPRRRRPYPEQRVDFLDQELINLGGAVPTGGDQLRCARQVQRRQDAAVGVGQLTHQRQLRRLRATLGQHSSPQLVRHLPGRSRRCFHNRHARREH